MTQIDSQRTQETLERARQHLGENPELSTEAAQRILETRAQLLAQPLPEPAAAEDVIELLVFSRAGATYAVDAAYVLEVVPITEPTPVPWVPPAVLGVINHRGRIIPVVDVARLESSQVDGAVEGEYAVVAVVGDACFGISADEVSGIAQVEERDVRSGAELGDERPYSVIRGLTAAMVAILDVEALVHDPRVEANDEVE
jgi:purine-binding chemotaxis protein CheW